MKKSTKNYFNKNSIKLNYKKAIILSSKVYFSFLIFGLLFVVLYPFIVKISLSLRSPIDYSNPHVIFIPEHFTLNNFKYAFRSINFGKLFANSFILSFVSVILQVLSTAMAGYAFAKLKFKFSNLIFYIVLFTITISKETLHISRVLFFVTTPFLGINLVGNLYAIFIMSAFGMGIRSAIFIYIFRQYFKNISPDLEESAQIDGAGIVKTFWNVSLPTARGAVLTVFIFAFVWSWNDAYFPYLFNLPSTGFNIYATQILSRRVSYIDAEALIMMFPLLVGYIFMQRFLINNDRIIIVY